MISRGRNPLYNKAHSEGPLESVLGWGMLRHSFCLRKIIVTSTFLSLSLSLFHFFFLLFLPHRVYTRVYNAISSLPLVDTRSTRELLYHASHTCDLFERPLTSHARRRMKEVSCKRKWDQWSTLLKSTRKQHIDVASHQTHPLSRFARSHRWAAHFPLRRQSWGHQFAHWSLERLTTEVQCYHSGSTKYVVLPPTTNTFIYHLTCRSRYVKVETVNSIFTDRSKSINIPLTNFPSLEFSSSIPSPGHSTNTCL